MMHHVFFFFWHTTIDNSAHVLVQSWVLLFDQVVQFLKSLVQQKSFLVYWA